MTYEFIDLGKPKYGPYSLTYIVTPNGNKMFKGSYEEVATNLKETKTYFGTEIQFGRNRTEKGYISKGFKLDRVWPRKGRPYFEFRTLDEDILLKKVRRLPKVWFPELNWDVALESGIAADFLEERGMTPVIVALLRDISTEAIITRTKGWEDSAWRPERRTTIGQPRRRRIY